MIGGLVAEKIDPNIMGRLAAGKRTALITGASGGIGGAVAAALHAAGASVAAPFGEVMAQLDAAIAAGMPRGTGAGDARALWRRHGSAGVAAIELEGAGELATSVALVRGAGDPESVLARALAESAQRAD